MCFKGLEGRFARLAARLEAVFGGEPSNQIRARGETQHDDVPSGQSRINAREPLYCRGSSVGAI